MKRTRLDFKWLCDKLKEEFPTIAIQQIDKGDLSKKVIEDFFKNLQNINVFQSRHINYFLHADDKMFEERKNNESSLVNIVMSKLRKSNCTLDSLKIDSADRSKVCFSR